MCERGAALVVPLVRGMAHDEDDEETRRYIASNLLKQYVDTYFSDSNVIILGDLNDQLMIGYFFLYCLLL